MPTVLHTPRLDHPDPEVLRAEIRAAFVSVWETYERVHPRFESLFAIGVDEMSWDDLDARN